MVSNTPASSTPLSSRQSPALFAAVILLVAANLRPTITAVGPVIDTIGDDQGLSATALGLLGALPVFTFAAVSPLVHLLATRLGMDRAVLAALVVLSAGTTVRYFSGISANLWVGTVLLAAAIGVLNVLLPAIIKRDFPTSVPVMTGLYTASMSAVAAVSSGIAVPLANWRGWETSLSIWLFLGLLGIAAWAWHLHGSTAAIVDDDELDELLVPEAEEHHPEQAKSGSMWSSVVAWQVALFMGFQSMVFYVTITWLPSIEISWGLSKSQAGWNLFAFQLVGIVSGLLVGPLVKKRADARWITLAVNSTLLIGVVGLLTAQSLSLLWILFLGLGSGAGIVLALTFMALRTPTPQDAGRLSGMAQGVGYLLAGLGPIFAGYLHESTDSWTPVLYLILVAGSMQTIMGVLASRDRLTHQVPA